MSQVLENHKNNEINHNNIAYKKHTTTLKLATLKMIIFTHTFIVPFFICFNSEPAHHHSRDSHFTLEWEGPGFVSLLLLQGRLLHVAHHGVSALH